jgi:hypothetical protein
MSGDGLFDFPDVGFLYVHDGFIVKTSTVDYEGDDDGFPTREATTDVPVKGYAAPPNPQRDGRTERVDTVYVVPNGTDVNADDMVRIPEQADLLAGLAGTYEISQMRPNPLHTRLLLTRAASPEISTENMATAGDA